MFERGLKMDCSARLGGTGVATRIVLFGAGRVVRDLPRFFFLLPE